ncbi:carbon-nitrogen hydrolase family protein [Williamsia herbipolensis]|uniref:Carbon-nitrogen hydrolase family protein n=1 Tax=Williamsia herbipolensis TaxID=1603258 RepID=A0AAU4K024_9NOCA|nr:carbon-nitrogen hydrolase family protein [Williamsia herbipolensis]
MRIAMAQVSTGTDPHANLDIVAGRTRQAAESGAELVVFPEATMCRFGVPLAPVAEPLDGPWATSVCAIAAEAATTVVVGMFTPADAANGRARVRNTLLVAGPDGSATSYDKIHLYDAYGFRESDTVAAGSAPTTISVAGHTVGLATCYDIRFPELFTALADDGAELIVVPASWGAGPGKRRQWRVLAQARALDSSTVVAAVGQALPDDPATATSSAPTGIGNSVLVDPFGELMAEYGEHEHLGVHDVDLERVEAARAAIGVLANRRLAPARAGVVTA